MKILLSINLPVSLRALKFYNFRLYFSGQAISLIGTWMQRIAVSWLVYSITHSALMLGVVASFLVMPYSTLLPVYAKTVFKGNVTTYGWLNSISGLGALMGAVFMTTLKPRRSPPKIIVYASLLMSVSLALFSFTTYLPVALFLLMIGEGGMLAQIAATNTYIQTNVEEKKRGRVISYYVMAFQGMQPIGSFLIGFSAHYISAPHTVLIEGLAGIATVLFFIPLCKRA